MAAYDHLTPARRAAVVLGGTLYDWEGYCYDYRAAMRVRDYRPAPDHESGERRARTSPAILLDWNCTRVYTPPGATPFRYSPDRIELAAFGDRVWPVVWQMWIRRSALLAALPPDAEE